MTNVMHQSTQLLLKDYLTSLAYHNSFRQLVVHVIDFITWRWMLSVWNNHAVSIIGAQLTAASIEASTPGFLATPSLDNIWQDSPSSLRRFDVQVRSWILCLLEVIIEWSGKRGIVEDGRWVAGCAFVRSQHVSSMRGDHLKHIGTDIPTTKRVEVPVGLDSADLRVVVLYAKSAPAVDRNIRKAYVEMMVHCTSELIWHGSAK